MLREPMFALLERIERRPEMFLGGSPEERDEQLRNLTWVLFGYQLALRDSSAGAGDFLREFCDFLVRTYGCSASQGPVNAVRAIAKSPDEAWTMFWKASREFKDSFARAP